MALPKPNVFLKQPGFNFQPRSVIIFIAAAVLSWVLLFLAQMTFPSDNLIPYLVRTTITLAIVLCLAKLSFYLLKRNRLSPDLLGLKLSGRVFSNLLAGAAIGLITIILLMTGLFLIVPFRYVEGPVHGWELFRRCYSYLLGNALEELMFRGFLLIILAQLTDWRKAVWIMALPFGLFHLPGLGFTMAGLKMVLTTGIFALIFGYAYILTGSLLTAIAAHATANILLHAFLGLDGSGNATYVPHFEGQWPAGYDAALVVSVVAGIIVAGALHLWIVYRNSKVRVT